MIFELGDIPAPGDFDGDGKFDATVFRPSSSTWYAMRSTAGTLIQTFGISGDKPVPNAVILQFCNFLYALCRNHK